MQCEDLLGISAFQDEARNNNSIVVTNPHAPFTHWAIPQKKIKTEEMLVQFNNFEFDESLHRNNSSNYDIRNTRKFRRVSIHKTFESNANSHSSILDDRTFAPPPLLPIHNNLIRFEFMAEQEANTSLLPSFEKVMHSGKSLSRISIKSLITKKWKDIFWVIYKNRLLVFRCIADYEEWLLNPYLSREGRSLLIKLAIDFERDLSVTGIRGYRSTEIRKKCYRNRDKERYQFKVDSMTLHGPSLVGAFASSDKGEIEKLHLLFNEMMGRSTLNRSLLKLSRRNTMKKKTSNSSSVPNFTTSNNERTAWLQRLDSRNST